MLAVERLKRIKNYMTENKTADLLTLSNLLCVSEATVRRDFDKLSKEGFLTKTHGGAIINEDDKNTTLAVDEIDDYYFEKSTIGEIASYMVNDNDTIILSAGSVCRYIAKKIKNKKNITVVTNDMKIASELSISPANAKILLTGGEMDPANMQLSGDFASSVLNSIYVNCAFIDVDGVVLNKGYFVDSVGKASIIKEILKVSQQAVAVCDFSKFSNPSFCFLGDFNTFDKIITNEQIPDDYKKMFFEKDIKLITTFNIVKEF